MFPFPKIEKLNFVAPLGMCFHDAATGERIIDGLSVSIYPVTKSIYKQRTTALPNRSGVYVLHYAYPLEDFSRGAGDAEFWAANPPQKLFVAEVVDQENRFQTFQFTLKLPVKGIYRWENIPSTSPNKNLSSIPLYSAPARKVTGGMSVIRAELRQNQAKSASWAVLEARFNGNLIARGIADREGQILLIFPALSPQNNPLISPPSNATRISLADQKWMLDLTVKYEPNIFQTSPSFSTENEAEVSPDLRLVLAQSNGRLWANAEKTEVLTTAVLQLGRELILRSHAAQILSPMPISKTAFSSYLFVSPA
ncbi:MAG: hypothetical protein ABJA66_12465 [Actinomycetota bacterium]